MRHHRYKKFKYHNFHHRVKRHPSHIPSILDAIGMAISRPIKNRIWDYQERKRDPDYDEQRERDEQIIRDYGRR